MSATPDNTATTWRDLTDQLTPDQVTVLEEHEADWPAATGELLAWARDYARHNVVDQVLADIAPPADATTLDDWVGCDAGGYLRHFDTWAHPDLPVSVGGSQHQDGSVARYVSVSEVEALEAMNAEKVRQFAAALHEAADKLDALNSAAAQ